MPNVLACPSPLYMPTGAGSDVLGLEHHKSRATMTTHNLIIMPLMCRARLRSLYLRALNTDTGILESPHNIHAYTLL